jgi:dTDP-4-dehydrorhamnose 3,5-epimerase
MRLIETPLEGAWLIELERIEDDRGWFARTFDAEQFAERGLESAVSQCNASFNRRRDTLRGMHYQEQPHGEAKLVRCVRGAIFDVAVDLRPASASYCRWHAVELSADGGTAFYIPKGMAHGFQTLSEDSEVQYQMSYHYVAEAARGVRFDDPAFAIEWPSPQGRRTISGRDATYPDFVP